LIIFSSILGNISSVNTTTNTGIYSTPTVKPLADIESPQFGVNGTATTAIIGDPFLFSINVTDDVSVNVVTVNYTWVSAGQWYNKTMAYSSGTTWINVSIMPIDPVTVVYQFWANDTSNNTNITGLGMVKVLDNIPPTSINGSGDMDVFCSTPFTIYANFSDNFNMSAATIFFRTDSNSTYRSANMTELVTPKWHYFVTNTTMGLNIYNNTENVSYYAIGYDNENNTAKYNDSGGKDWNITIIDDVAPEPITGSGDMRVGTGDYFSISVNFSDNINATRAVIHYKQDSGTGMHQYEMTPALTQNPGENVFETNILNLSEASGISTINKTESIQYYIIGYDEVNNTGNYSNTTFFPGSNWLITVWDNDPPQIINGSGDFTTTTGDPFTIYVNFTDNIKISHASIYYKRKGSPDPYLTSSMQETVGIEGNFYITYDILGLDTFYDNTALYYYVIAYDETGNLKQYTKPGSSGYKITIIDNDKPEHQSCCGNITIGTGDSFNIYANFSDNILIKYIRFFYMNEHWDHWESNIFSVEDPNRDLVWEFNISSNDLDVEIDTANDDSDFYYFIRVFDGKTPKPNMLNHTVGTQGFVITVVDDDPPEMVANAAERGSGSFKATTGEAFTIYANFTDNIEVDYAELFIRKILNGDTWSLGYSMTESATMNGRFHITSSELEINTTINDTDYEYYVLCYDTTGNVYTYQSKAGPFIIDVIDNDDPVADAGPDVLIEEENTVTFDASGSYDNIGIVSYEWAFIYDRLEYYLNDEITSFKFNKPGNYRVTLTIIDGNNNIGIDKKWVNVTVKNYPPEILVVKPEDGVEIYAFSENINIFVRFSEDMVIDEKNVSFFFINDSAGNPVEGIFEWYRDDVKEEYKLYFNPISELKYNEQYTLTITRNVREKFAAGLLLKSGITWSFSTYPEDSDNDGLPDWWEVNFFPDFQINEVGPDADDDNDGFTNIEEYLGLDGKPGGDDSTNPRDKNSHPPIKKEDEESSINLILIVVVVILVILFVVILFMGMAIRKKKKEEEEEAKKPKPIEHEILFEDGRGLPGAAQGIEPGISEEGAELEMELEPELQTEMPIQTPTTASPPGPEPELEPEPFTGAEGDEMEPQEMEDAAIEPELDQELEPDLDTELEMDDIEDTESTEEGVSPELEEGTESEPETKTESESETDDEVDEQ
jgi:hypothetical protein